MSFDEHVKKYLRSYQGEFVEAVQNGQHTAELSFRAPLNTLFKDISKDLNSTGGNRINVILEPGNQNHLGRPDWMIQDSISMGIYGYIEGKGPSAEIFDISPYREQINRYLTLGHKLVITDGIDFYFCFNSNENPIRVSIIDKNRMCVDDWGKLDINPQFRFYMSQFFSNPTPQRLSEEELVKLVAVRTRNLSDDIRRMADVREDQARNNEEREVIELLNGLKNLVYSHNDPIMHDGAVFSDFVAQVIMFSLLYAHRVLCSSTDTPVEKAEKIKNYVYNDLVEGEAMLPFRNLMIYLRDHEGNETETFIGHWVKECISFLSFVQMSDEQLANPDYHKLFELFLEKFNNVMRFDYGAFYTPKELAYFMVRLTDKIAAKDLSMSIYDDGNMIIDPCCGTGSILEQVILNDTHDGAYSLSGFEILPAPYMLANYRMFNVKKTCFKRNLNINIVLTNTLGNTLLGEDVERGSILGDESVRAFRLCGLPMNMCSIPLKLIIGSLPCSDSATVNKGEEFSRINELMEDFRPPIENRHARQNIQKQVKNPFMQFLRWSCEKLKGRNHAVMAEVVPLSFLNAESYKYARKFLIENFSNIWVVALDADSRTGIRTENLYKNVRQGRALIVLTRMFGDDSRISSFNYVDISGKSRSEKIKVLESDVDEIIGMFRPFNIMDDMYSFMPPSGPYDNKLYLTFWPISNNNGDNSVFLNQCSGAKMAPTALMTHVKYSMLIRRSREIACAGDGLVKAKEWVGKQDKPPKEEKTQAFINTLKPKIKQLGDKILENNIVPCSFRPFVNSYAFLWDDMFNSLTGACGNGTRIRPEIKAVYRKSDTIGFSLAPAPKDLSESLDRFASFCWYFPDNDLCARGNGHIYLNQYVNTEHNKVEYNVNRELLEHFTDRNNGLTEADVARKLVFYSYAIFCSHVYLNEFYGALFVVNQSENRARIPIVSEKKYFQEISSLGEKMAKLEKIDADVDNILKYDYEGIMDQLPEGFHLKHRRSARNGNGPYDEENEQILLKDEDSDTIIRVYCPINVQKFTVSGYNVVKDCWLKFHSYRYTHCEFKKDDLKELMNLFNRIYMQMQYVSDVDKIMKKIVEKKISLLAYDP